MSILLPCSIIKTLIGIGRVSNVRYTEIRMHIYRARVAKNIIMEFAVPQNAQVQKKCRAIIIASGMPSASNKHGIMEFLAGKGFWVFNPRYRGSWESGGTFLAQSPEKDIGDVIAALPKGFRDPWMRRSFRLKPAKLYIVANSFGGPAGMFLTRYPRVTGVIAISPVVEWRKMGPAEPFDWLYGFVKEVFGEGYRMTRKTWNKLKGGKFYNPATNISRIDGEKLLIIHAKDDRSVPWRPVAAFAEKTGAKLIMLKRGGHLSSSLLSTPRHWDIAKKFMRTLGA
ncbi:MAG: prolyl oligopeptidase family serine peptidase [bacterium]|nr:prolyl oligopeptidase family serine peptidase [bacterium]